MTPEAGTDAAELDLRFDATDESPPAPPACSACGGTISAQYYEAGGAIVCPECRTAIEARSSSGSGSGSGRLARAAVYGIGGAIAGAALYYAIVAITGYEIGLVAIAVGWLVGRGVQRGSGERGGRGYQVMAVVLTYLAIVSTYVPFMMPGFEIGAGGLGLLLIVAAAAPFLAGIDNIIGIAIIGFALYQAWRMNARATVVFTGPYAVGTPRAAADA